MSMTLFLLIPTFVCSITKHDILVSLSEAVEQCKKIHKYMMSLNNGQNKKYSNNWQSQCEAPEVF